MGLGKVTGAIGGALKNAGSTTLNGIKTGGEVTVNAVGSGGAGLVNGLTKTASLGFYNPDLQLCAFSNHQGTCDVANKVGDVGGHAIGIVGVTVATDGAGDALLAARGARVAEEGAELARGAAGAEGSEGETFFRTMSKEHFDELHATGRVPASSETFITESSEYASRYEGRKMEFRVRPGTTDALAKVGVHDSSAATAAKYPDMPPVSSGWAANSAFFKGEEGLINIGLGRGHALDIFNDSIVGFREVP